VGIALSIITPCFNSVTTLRETLRSVWEQNYRDFEHLVIDGGSTDGTLALLKEHPHLNWISESDQGHYHAMNKGIDRATGDVIAILNADDCYRPGVLGLVAAAFRDHPDWDGLFGDVVFVDGEGREMYRRKEAIYDYDTLRFAFNYVCHHTLFVKRSVYRELGAYRYQQFKNACDYDFILRLGHARRRIGKIHEFLVNYRYHLQGQSLDRRIAENTVREMQIVKREHGVPDGLPGGLCYLYGHARRQFQKLWHRGTCDLIPATWILRKHMREKTAFSSNIGLDKL
jgi:glycosyltransferase involved in cell wall biosynthesis